MSKIKNREMDEIGDSEIMKTEKRVGEGLKVRRGVLAPAQIDLRDNSPLAFRKVRILGVPYLSILHIET